MSGRCTWPVAAVRGSASTTATRRGCLYGASRPSQNVRIAAASGATVPGRATTTAVTISPHWGSGNPTTATSAIAGWDARTCSTSTGATVSPPVRMTSRARPTIDRYPSSSSAPRSPVWYQPSRNAVAVAAGSSKYPSMRNGLRTQTSPAGSSRTSTAGWATPTLPGLRAWGGKGFEVI